MAMKGRRVPAGAPDTIEPSRKTGLILSKSPTRAAGSIGISTASEYCSILRAADFRAAEAERCDVIVPRAFI